MKSFRFLCLPLLFVQWAFGQEFHFQLSHALPDTATFYGVEWADADNDGILDAFTFGKNTDDETFCLLLRNDRLQGLQVAGQFRTGLKDVAWRITDIDGDNAVDVMISGLSGGGAVTSQFLNKGSFVFEETPLFDRHANFLDMADLDQDGMREILLSGHHNGKPFLNIFKWRNGGWASVYDSLTVAASALQLFDLDGDSDIDFFIAGVDESNKSIARTFYNQGGFYFKSGDVARLSGSSSKADLNDDGAFDVLIAGEDGDGAHKMVAWLNDGRGIFTPKDTLLTGLPAEVVAADFNSDGFVDVSIFGYDDTDTTNFIQSSVDVWVPHKYLVSQSWGDGDRDGDLDLLQLIKTSEGQRVQLFRNTTLPANAAPLAPSRLVIAPIMNRLFVSWVRSTDDHTSENSLTYDVAIQTTEKNVMSADFDVLNGRRLNVSHGNNGTADYLLLQEVGTANVGVQIQAVDNAFHAGPESICKGSGGGGRGLCSEVETVSLALCKNETVTLTGSLNTRWFSFERGFLADTSALTFHFQRPDTIFSVTRNPDCAHIAVYILESGENVTHLTESSSQLCEGEVVEFGVEAGWESVEWSSASVGFLSAEDTIVYTAIRPDTISVRLSDANGCIVQRNTTINLSKPVITGDDTYQILKGQSVRLNVSGGTTYEWDPTTGLDNATSADPVATPLATTEYTVTVSDSSGCQSSMRILVLVEETAFIPNLFTPNQDGKNDALKIYGLSQVTNFSFTIYNRAGLKVYHSEDIQRAATEGWNGTAGGVDQPGGVYYWNVSGQTAGGKELKLNGRTSGSIVLLR